MSKKTSNSDVKCAKFSLELHNRCQLTITTIPIQQRSLQTLNYQSLDKDLTITSASKLMITLFLTLLSSYELKTLCPWPRLSPLQESAPLPWWTPWHFPTCMYAG